MQKCRRYFIFIIIIITVDDDERRIVDNPYLLFAQFSICVEGAWLFELSSFYFMPLNRSQYYFSSVRIPNLKTSTQPSGTVRSSESVFVSLFVQDVHTSI